MIRLISHFRIAPPAIAALAIAACAAGEEAASEGAASEETTSDRPAERVALLIPGSDTTSNTAPDTFSVKFETNKGDFVIEVHRDWAPHGADRFYYLVRNGFYDEVRFFRVLTGFMAQFGVNGDPKVSSVWRGATIPDDPVKQSNQRGFISYAMAGADTRTTQVFINYVDNSNLDGAGFAPFGQVTEGMEVVDQFYAGYGEGAPDGRGPSQSRIQTRGNPYLESSFPRLDYVIRATIVEQ